MMHYPLVFLYDPVEQLVYLGQVKRGSCLAAWSRSSQSTSPIRYLEVIQPMLLVEKYTFSFYNF